MSTGAVDPGAEGGGTGAYGVAGGAPRAGGSTQTPVTQMRSPLHSTSLTHPAAVGADVVGTAAGVNGGEATAGSGDVADHGAAGGGGGGGVCAAAESAVQTVAATRLEAANRR